MADASPAASASPYEELDNFFRKATTILNEAYRGPSRASRAQYQIRQLARPLFDVRGAARRVLGPEWSALSVGEREEFIRLFGDHLLSGYLSLVRGKLSRDRPPTIRLVAEEVGAGGRVALVRTVIRAKDDGDVRFDYVMSKAGASWLVQDVMVGGVSLIENYRAQVAQVVRGSSYSGLVSRLRSGPADGGRSSPRQPDIKAAVQPAAPQTAEKP
jgi:ABC-type transporter MlaC component